MTGFNDMYTQTVTKILSSSFIQNYIANKPSSLQTKLRIFFKLNSKTELEIFVDQLTYSNGS